MSPRTWRLSVTAAVALGLGIRIASVLARPHLVPAGDPAEYFGQSNLLVAGYGWIEPVAFYAHGLRHQTANLPPLYTMLQALCSLVGFKTFFAHRIWSAILSTGGVAMAAVVGRDLVGRRVSVLAAFGVALYPNLWVSVSLGMSETISPVLVLIVLWAAYRMWRCPGWKEAAILGLAVGLAALARDELIIFSVLIILPLAIGPKGRPWKQRLRLVSTGALGVVVIVAPWVTFNMTRFSHPVLITDRFGAALASANCDSAWKGEFAGFWWMSCFQQSVAGTPGDESAQDPVATRVALDYIGRHVGGIPAVEAKRLGRTFGFYQVRQQIGLDVFVEGRPRVWAWVGLWAYYGLAALSLFGAWRLRKSGVPLFPLGAVLVDVLFVVLITYGQTRFRATLEPVLVLLAAVTVDDLLRRRRPAVAPRRPVDASCPEPSGPRSEASSVGAPPAVGGA